jgi:hypothetical protein
MNLQEKMFIEVEAWYALGDSKVDFLNGKEYNEAKFNSILKKHIFVNTYWISFLFFEIQTLIFEFLNFQLVERTKIVSQKFLPMNLRHK